MVEGGSQQFRWPADMERRRIADLQEFQRHNPGYVFTPEQLPGASGNRCRAKRRGRPSAKTTGKKANYNENRWCLATTLQLLEEMKMFVRANKLPCLGDDIVKWRAIATNLANPCGLESRKLARSSMVLWLHLPEVASHCVNSPSVRFDNLRRNFRTSLRARIPLEVRNSMIEYFRICERHKTPGTTTAASTKFLATMDMALSCELAPLSPPSTPATPTIFRGQTSVPGNGEPLVDDDDDRKAFADESCGGGDDNAIDLRSASGSPHWTSDTVDTPTTILCLPAAERESSDQEAAGRSCDADSWAAPDRLRSRLPKAETSSAVRRGIRRRTLTY